MVVNESPYWNKIEVAPKSEIEEIQLKRLKQNVKYAYGNSKFYHDMYNREKFDPEDLKTLEDIHKVPLFRKDDLREQRKKMGDPFGDILCVPMKDIISIFVSTGTSGDSTFLPYSYADIDYTAEATARFLWMMGLRAGDKITGTGPSWHWNPPTMSAAFYKIGAIHTANVLPHPIMASRFLKLIKATKPDGGLLALNLVLALTEEAINQGYKPSDIYSCFKAVATAGETVGIGTRKKIIDDWKCGDVFDLAGLSDPYINFLDCPEHDRHHYWQDMYRLGLVDPDTDEVINPASGERGEYVVTALLQKATPYIRFGTEDLAEIYPGDCGCGRTHNKITVFGRASWRINIAGKSIMPEDVRRVIEVYPETQDAAFTIIIDEKKMSKLKINAFHIERITKAPEELKEKLQKDIKEKLGVESEINWVKYEELPILFHKITRVTDLTKQA